MKMYVIILNVFLIVSSVIAEYDSICIPTNYGELLVSGNSIKEDINSFVETNNITTNEIEQILITYINYSANSTNQIGYSSVMALSVLAETSKSDNVKNYIGSIIESDKSYLYFTAINEFLKIQSFSDSAFLKVVEYIEISDEFTSKRQHEIFLYFSLKLEQDNELSLQAKLNMVKIMINIINIKQETFFFIDTELCDKIPSYRISVQRKKFIDLVSQKMINSIDGNSNKLQQIIQDFNNSLEGRQMINLIDEIIKEEIRNYKSNVEYIEGEA